MRVRFEFEVEMTETQTQHIRGQIEHSRVWYDKLARFFDERFGEKVALIPGTFNWYRVGEKREKIPW